MKKTLICGALSVAFVLFFALPAIANVHHVMPSGDTSGITDTAAIQELLDLCAASGHRCTIQLGTGDFHVQQLAVSDFHGTLRGKGIGETTVSAVPDLIVANSVAMWESYPTPAGGANPWPILLTFIGGKITLSDISFEVMDPEPTTGWRTRDGGERWHLWAVVQVTGESAHSSIKRIHVKGVEAPPPAMGYSILVGVQFAGEVGPWLGGRHSVTSSHFEAVSFGAEGWHLEKAWVNIGRGFGKGNTMENCRFGAVAGNLNRSTISITGNDITPAWVGIGLWSTDSEEPSWYVAKGNTIHLSDTSFRGFCISDDSVAAGGDPVLKAVLMHNRIEMGNRHWQRGVSIEWADRALVAGNTISCASCPESPTHYWAIWSSYVSRSKFLVNNLKSFGLSPKIQLVENTDCLVVTEEHSDVEEDGGSGNRIISWNH